MSPLKRSNNIAARMGRWSARHRKTAIFGWLAFVVAAVAIGGAVGTKQLGETTRCRASPGRRRGSSKTGSSSLPARPCSSRASRSRRAAPRSGRPSRTSSRRVSTLGVVANVESPYAAGNGAQISADGHSAIVNFDIRGDSEKAVDKIDPVIDAVQAAAARIPAFSIDEFGVSAEKQLDEKFARTSNGPACSRAGHDRHPRDRVRRAGGGGIPLLLALSAVMATMGLLAIPSQFWPVDENISAIVLLIGLAVGVDYSMFYLKREREERAAGRASARSRPRRPPSGRAVLISGLTVMTAMAGMFLTGDETFGSIAMATILVVAIAELGSLTVLPALLSWLGDRANKARVPSSTGSSGRREGRGWGWILDRVLRGRSSPRWPRRRSSSPSRFRRSG